MLTGPQRKSLDIWALILDSQYLTVKGQLVMHSFFHVLRSNTGTETLITHTRALIEEEKTEERKNMKL